MHRQCDRTVPGCHCTHTNAVVPALSLGLPRLDTHATTHCPPAQAMAPLDFVGNYPDLKQTFVRAPGPTAEGQLDTQGRDQRGNPSSHSQVACSPPHLVQWPHRHFAHIVGHMLPAGALRVARGDPCSVPQVPWGETQPRSSEKSFWPILSCCGVSPQLPLNPPLPRALG